jgi:uncharacterized Zn finger protein (UPF0148 family)
MRCPFCASEKDENALVCPICNRDTAVPQSLRAEHEELLRKRDSLRAELAQAKDKLAARLRWRKLHSV